MSDEQPGGTPATPWYLHGGDKPATPTGASDAEPPAPAPAPALAPAPAPTPVPAQGSAATQVLPAAAGPGPVGGPVPAPANPPGGFLGGGRRTGIAVAAGAVVLLAGGAVGWAVLSPKAATPHAQSAPAALSTSASSTSSAAATTSSAPSSTSTSPSSSAAATSSSSSVAAPSPSAAAPPATPPGYGSYTNPRFGFSTLVPANFVAQPQLSDDSSFQWADSASGAVTVRAFAENNTDGNTVDDELSSRSQGINVTWSQIKGQVLTLTGFVDDGQTIVYLREVVGQGSENLLEWTYPAKDKQQWDSAVTTTALGFRPGDVTAPH